MTAETLCYHYVSRYPQKRHPSRHTTSPALWNCPLFPQPLVLCLVILMSPSAMTAQWRALPAARDLRWASLMDKETATSSSLRGKWKLTSAMRKEMPTFSLLPCHVDYLPCYVNFCPPNWGLSSLSSELCGFLSSELGIWPSGRVLIGLYVWDLRFDSQHLKTTKSLFCSHSVFIPTPSPRKDGIGPTAHH